MAEPEERIEPLTAPFPWYGGKSLAAPIVWRAFGNVPNFVEPFAGSMAVLLARPHAPKVETVNDKDGFIANFWRAVQLASDEVEHWCDWPVNEADLHARHQWLVDRKQPLLDQLVADPDYYDAKIAGWWVWGICTWIGGGWCHPDRRLWRGRPELANANGRGVHALSKQMPAVGKPGSGVHSPTAQGKWRPDLSSAGRGIHNLSRKKPLTHRNKGVHKDSAVGGGMFAELAARLRRVRVCCGDWTRILGRSTLGIDTAHGMTPCGVFLDPPYSHDIRDKRLYTVDDDVAGAVREWALANGDNPQLRIALCGFEGEHEMPSSWQKAEWKSKGSTKNHDRERIWFSPHCNDVVLQRSLFE